MSEHRTTTSEKARMAICYDFDKTLSPDDMQAFTLIPSFGIDKTEFWDESNKLAKDKLMDKNLAWMYELTRYSNFKNKSLKKEYFQEVGTRIPLYRGVETWFDRMNKYAASKGIELQHYIISSGLKEIIEGSSIASKFNRIYASSYLYNTDGIAIWPTQAINYTNKTQYIFRIAKGFFEEYDERVNDSMEESKLYIPYENIVYIGDSETDIPCMRLVKSKGGYAIGVFDPEKNNRKRVYQLYNDKRINFYAPADYSSRSSLSKCMRKIIDEIAAHEQIRSTQQSLEIPARKFKAYTQLREILDEVKVPSKQKKQMEKDLEQIKNSIDGNID